MKKELGRDESDEDCVGRRIGETASLKVEFQNSI